MAQLALIATAAGGALNAAGTVMEGRERSRAAAFEAQQLSQQEKEHRIHEQEYRTAADQAEARRRENLTSSLETIAAIRAGRGVGQASPTAVAIYDSIIDDEERDARTERYNYLSKADRSRIAADQSRTAAGLARRRSKTSLIASYISAGAKVAETAGKVYSAGR